METKKQPLHLIQLGVATVVDSPVFVLAKFNGVYLGVSKNRGTPKSFILIGFSIINHPFWGTTIFLETPI